MANVELLEKVYEYIENNPQKWKQSVWFAILDEDGKMTFNDFEVEVEEVNSCNTAFCFAGHTALMTGFVAPPKVNGALWEGEVDGKYYAVNEYAKEKLGITWDQADELFAAENSMEDIRKIIDMIKDNPHVDQEEIQKALDRWTDYEDDWDCDCCREDDDDETTW